MMTTDSNDVVDSKRVLIFLYAILFFRCAMQITWTHTAYPKNNIEHKKSKPLSEFYIVALSRHRLGGNIS